MNVFPYISSYILLYAVIAFLVFLIVPAPYGKFSKDYLPLLINARLAWFLNQFGALIIIVGYFEDGVWKHKMPSTSKGWVAFIFIILHFLWRSVFSQLVLEYVIKPPNGEKQTSLLLPFLGFLYYPAVGMNFRQMVVNMDQEYQFEDTIFLVAAMVCLAANAFIDMQFNQWRKEEGFEFPYIGKYLTRESIGERFGLLYKLGFHSPNYLFEILEWGFFTLFVFRWEALWWFVATLLYLLPRSIWTSHWYSLPFQNQNVAKAVPQVFQAKSVQSVKPKTTHNANSIVF